MHYVSLTLLAVHFVLNEAKVKTSSQLRAPGAGPGHFRELRAGAGAAKSQLQAERQRTLSGQAQTPDDRVVSEQGPGQEVPEARGAAVRTGQTVPAEGAGGKGAGLGLGCRRPLEGDSVLHPQVLLGGRPPDRGVQAAQGAAPVEVGAGGARVLSGATGGPRPGV
jgi:hypothetical protein